MCQPEPAGMRITRCVPPRNVSDSSYANADAEVAVPVIVRLTSASCYAAVLTCTEKSVGTVIEHEDG